MTRPMLIRLFLMASTIVAAGAFVLAQSSRPAPATTRATRTAATTRSATTAATQHAAAVPDPDKAPPKPSFELSESATQAESVITQLRGMEADLNADQITTTIKSDLPVLTTEINARLEETARLIESAPSLQLLESQQEDWNSIHEELAGWAAQLAQQLDHLRADREETKVEGPGTPHDGKLVKDWRLAEALARYYLPNPRAVAIVTADLKIIDATIDRISKTDDLVHDRLLQVVKLQGDVNGEDAQVLEVLESLKESRAGAISRLLIRNEPPVWHIFQHGTSERIVTQGQDSFHRQLQAVWAYIARRRANVGGQIFLLLVLATGIYFARRKVFQWADADPGFQPAKVIFASPMSTAVVLSLIFSIWIYPQAPRLFWAMVGAAALIPTVVILRRLIDRRLFPILDALVVFYFMDQIRTIAAAVPMIPRLLFLFQMLGAGLLLASFIFSIRAQAAVNRVWKVILIISWLELVTFTLAFLADAVGYVSLASLLGDAALKSAYLAVILYAAIALAIGLVVIALRTRPLSSLGMVRRHHALLLHRLTVAIEWLAALGWLFGLLAMLSLASAVYEIGDRFFNTEVGVGGVAFSLIHVVKFVFVVWASFFLSRFLRFILEEDVYGRFSMPSGLAYAVSKMLNYAVLLLGFCYGVHLLGLPLTQFTILVSAFGVGLGFGLQNIVNNFVSGLILLFERPVKVGDVIQMGDVSGVVTYIGIRASVLRTAEAAEIIIPNGNLISSQVTNWTHTNRQRGISIPISIATTADPKRVMDVLTSTAAAHPQVVKSPPPQAFLLKFSADSYSYELHVWTDEAVHWIHIRSDISVALNAAFVRENIPIK